MQAGPLTVHRQEWAGGRWEMVKAPPAAPLRGLVRDYTGYTERSALPLSRTEVPSGDVALIISGSPSSTPFSPAACSRRRCPIRPSCTRGAGSSRATAVCRSPRSPRRSAGAGARAAATEEQVTFFQDGPGVAA